MDLFVSANPKDSNYAAYLARLTDQEFYSHSPQGFAQCDIYNAENKKRRKAREELVEQQETRERQAKDREQQRIDQERQAALNRRKDALQFSDALASEICERISAGELVTVICDNLDHMPTVRRCNMWLRLHPEFAALYEQSLQDRLAIFEEQLIQIPDEAARDLDVITDKKGTRRVQDPAKVTMAKLRVEVRRLHLKAGRPQKWGDTSTLITKSEDPFDPSNLSAEELERRIAELERKDATVKSARAA
jgi:hypothetical protein